MEHEASYQTLEEDGIVRIRTHARNGFEEAEVCEYVYETSLIFGDNVYVILMPRFDAFAKPRVRRYVLIGLVGSLWVVRDPCVLGCVISIYLRTRDPSLHPLLS